MKQIYLLLLIFTILPPLNTHKTPIHFFKCKTKCLEDLFDINFFSKIPNNCSIKPSDQTIDPPQANLTSPNEILSPEPQPQPQENFANKLLGDIGGFFKKMPSSISQQVQQVGKKAKEFSQKAINDVKDVGSKSLNFVSSKAIDGANGIKEKAKDLSGSIVNKAQDSWETIKDSSRSVGRTVCSIGEKAKETSKSVGEKLVTYSKKIVDSIKDVASKTTDTVEIGATDTVNNFKENTREVSQKVSDKVKEGWNNLKKVPEVMKDVLNKIMSHESDVGGKVKNGVLKGMSSLFDSLKNISSKVFEGVSAVEVLILKTTPQILETVQESIENFFLDFPQKGQALNEKWQELKSFLSQTAEWLFSPVLDKVYQVLLGVAVVLGDIIRFIWGGGSWFLYWVHQVLLVVVVVLGFYVFIQVRPFLMAFLQILSFLNCCKRSKGNDIAPKKLKTQDKVIKKEEREIISPGVRRSEVVKLNREDFQMNRVSLKADKIMKNNISCFLRYHLHYEILHFPTLEGEILLKLITSQANAERCGDVFKVPVEEFVCKSTWDGCLFQNSIDKDSELVNVRLCVDFKGHNGQYFLIYSDDFKLVFE